MGCFHQVLPACARYLVSYQSDYPTCRGPVAANDLLLLFTDGLYEVYDGEGVEYGQERLLKAVRQRMQMPADRLFDELLRDVKRFSRAEEFEDDVCLVGAEIARLENHPSQS